MKGKKLFVIAVAALLMGAGCQANVATNNEYGANSEQPAAAMQKNTSGGKVIISVTDAAASMQGVSSVQLTVDKIEMHSAAKGWVTISNDTKQFDLLALKARGALSVAVNATVAAGTYNQVRLHVPKVIVVKSGVTTEAKLPSNTLEINGTFSVTENTTTSIKFDFIADESLHVTGDGKFIFAPVVKTESRTKANVSITADGLVTVGGGSVENAETAGMDLHGAMQENFILETKGTLEINNNGDIQETDSSSLKVKAGTDLKIKGAVY